VSAEYTIQDQPGVRLDHNVLGTRIVASLIDGALFVILFLLLAASIGTFGESSDGRYEIRLDNGAFVLYLLIVYGYYIVFEGLIGATVGKLMMGLQVVDLEGHPIGLGKAFIRSILRIVDGLPVLYLVGFVCAAVTSKHQRLGDMAAGTLVVRT
jgi:uncharacterized RDD family membrane protein YckC